MIPGLSCVRAAAAGVLVAISATPAQPQASPHGFPVSQRGSVTQMVAFTEIAIAYGRPAARGRALFGALVPWDSVWHRAPIQRRASGSAGRRTCFTNRIGGAI